MSPALVMNEERDRLQQGIVLSATADCRKEIVSSDTISADINHDRNIDILFPTGAFVAIIVRIGPVGGVVALHLAILTDRRWEKRAMQVGGDRRKNVSTTGLRSVAIVGNAPEMTDQSVRIDAADWVVRFNNTAGFGHYSGRRITHLVLVNHGGQMREWLADPAFTRRRVVEDAEAILFPFARRPLVATPEDEDGRCWTREAEAMLAPLGKRVDILPDGVRDEAKGILSSGLHPPPPPSTGFLVALYLARTLPAAVRIDIHGFGFAGWCGHAWARERQWFEGQAAAGRLMLHPLDGTLAA